jgi:hypothetical protein
MGLFRFFLTASLFFLSCSTCRAAAVDRVSQYGITWIFDRAYETGTFANGDYWVVGPVKIIQITPDYNGKHHGWQVNPVPNSGPAFDCGMYYNSGTGSPAFTPSNVPALPYVAQPGTSIVKAISIVSDPANCLNCVDDGADYHASCLKTSAVLTIVSAVPADSGTKSFRPPYVGTSKPLYSTTNLRTDLLPSIAAPELGTPDLTPGQISRVQLDHFRGWVARMGRPYENLPDYGGAVAVQINNAVSRLFLDVPLSQKMPLLIATVQAGIDTYYIAVNGQTWDDGSGHEPGRKLLIAFAATLLDDSAMKTYVAQTKFFNEDQGVQSGMGGRALFGFTAYNSYDNYWEYTAQTAGSNSEYHDPYGMIDGGANFGHMPNNYQTCCLSQPWKGAALALHLIPALNSVWNNPLLVRYVDRWVQSGTLYQPDECAPVDPVDKGKTRAQFTKYGITWGHDRNTGTCVKDTTPADGIGRWPQNHETWLDGGPTYRSPVVDALWRIWASNSSTSPSAPKNLRVGNTAAGLLTPTITSPADQTVFPASQGVVTINFSSPSAATYLVRVADLTDSTLRAPDTTPGTTPLSVNAPATHPLPLGSLARFFLWF